MPRASDTRGKGECNLQVGLLGSGFSDVLIYIFFLLTARITDTHPTPHIFQYLAWIAIVIVSDLYDF